MEEENIYQLFELPNFASMKDIKEQYKKLVKKYHPDKINNLNSNSNSSLDFNITNKFIIIKDVYEKIQSNLNYKNLFDERLKVELEIQEKAREISIEDLEKEESNNNSENKIIEAVLAFNCEQCFYRNTIKRSVIKLEEVKDKENEEKNNCINGNSNNKEKIYKKENQESKRVKNTIIQCSNCSLYYSIV